MNKKQRKQLRRERIARVIKTQNAWIEKALCVEPLTRRERDRLFGQALKVLGHAAA
jgi:hypothetical protein